MEIWRRVIYYLEKSQNRLLTPNLIYNEIFPRRMVNGCRLLDDCCKDNPFIFITVKGKITNNKNHHKKIKHAIKISPL